MTTMFTGHQIIADIEFDAVTSEAHSMEATATQYAVDGGGKVSDHVTVLPDSLEIRGGISNADGGERARTLIAELDMHAAVPLDCLAYRFDLVLRGHRATLFENRTQGAAR